VDKSKEDLPDITSQQRIYRHAAANIQTTFLLRLVSAGYVTAEQLYYFTECY